MAQAERDVPRVCPRCGHESEYHPLNVLGSARICSVAIGELPSCVKCAAPMANLLEKRAAMSTDREGRSASREGRTNG